MNEYEFYVDAEMTEWRRLYIRVPATSPEQAQEYAKSVFESGGSDALEEQFGIGLGWESLIETSMPTGKEELMYMGDDDIIVHRKD